MAHKIADLVGEYVTVVTSYGQWSGPLTKSGNQYEVASALESVETVYFVEADVLTVDLPRRFICLKA